MASDHGKTAADGGRQVRDLETRRTAIHQTEPLEPEHPRPRADSERAGDPSVREHETTPKESRGHALTLRGQIAGEGAQMQDVVVDDRRGHEGAKAMPPGDEPVALRHVFRLPAGFSVRCYGERSWKDSRR